MLTLEEARLMHLRDLYSLVLNGTATISDVKESKPNIYRVVVSNSRGAPLTVCFLAPFGEFPKYKDFPL